MAKSAPAESSGMHRSHALSVLVTLAFAVITGSLLHPSLWLTPALPTGGDLASHVLYFHTLLHDALPQGRLRVWMPEVFAGYPLLHYYFPLPLLIAALLALPFGEGAGLKLAVLLPALLLPGAVYVSARWLRLGFAPALLGACGAWVFLVHEANSIWGGNLQALFAGEFAYAWGLLLVLPALALWGRLLLIEARPGLLALVVLVEAAAGLAHGYALLAVGFGSLSLALIARPLPRAVAWLALGHGLAFCLLGFWLWPLFEMHALTTPNDLATRVGHWSEILSPTGLYWCLAGCVALLSCALWPRARRIGAWPVLAYLGAAALWPLAGWLVAGQIGLADLRCAPIGLFLAMVCAGWWIGTLLEACHASAGRAGWSALAGGLIVLGLAADEIENAPRWAGWTLAGYQGKPNWQRLSGLFPQMSGTLASPRLLFEHDPSNTDLGSTRALEALPMFLGGRPVLEGLYMESALLAPLVYLTQAEASQQPSSPLGRYPSAQLAPARAAVHLAMLGADAVLLRSEAAKAAFAASGRFVLRASHPPFELWALREPPAPLIEPLPLPARIEPIAGWRDHAFTWFASLADAVPSAWPLYRRPGDAASVPVSGSAELTLRDFARDRLRLHTSAPGVPILLRMAWHPGWQLRTAGRIDLAAPGFMLITPNEAEVELVFDDTRVALAGKLASLLALIALGGLIGWRRPVSPLVARPAGVLILLPGLLLCAWAGMRSPEQDYLRGWSLLQAGEPAQAAPLLEMSASMRKGLGRQQEARYWAAVAWLEAGRREEAVPRLTGIAFEPAGHWVAEALLRLLRLPPEVALPYPRETLRARLAEVAPSRIKELAQ